MIEGIKELGAGITLALQGTHKIFTTFVQGVLLLLLVLFILYLTSVASKALISLFKYLEEKSQKKESKWNAFVTALQKPAGLIVWIVGVSFALEIIHIVTNAEIFVAIPPIRTVAIIATLAWFFIRLSNNLEKNFFLMVASSKSSQKDKDEKDKDV